MSFFIFKDELFEIGKNQILDQIIKLSHLTSDFWLVEKRKLENLLICKFI